MIENYCYSTIIRFKTIPNEMVSAGDTDISLHIRPGQNSKTSKCQDLSKFEFSGRGRGEGVFWEAKTQKPLSAKICLNLNLGGRGVFWGSQNSKCQVLAKFSFPGRGCKLGFFNQIFTPS